MKKTLYIILALLLVSGLAATGQIQRGKKPAQSKPKTEQPQGQNNSTSSKKKKTQKTDSSPKTNKQSAQQSSGRSSSDTQVRQSTSTARQASDSPKIETFTANGVSFDMVWVEGGTFTMGATSEQGSDAYDVEKPTHQVTLSGYYIGKYEVTQALWQAVMRNNPSKYKGDSNRPVEQVSWNDCQEFISKLNQLTGKTFRLPTEAEWEFAARGGNKSKHYKYAGSDHLDDVAWYEGNTGYMTMTPIVGTKYPNELGLYDMSGSVSEWCQDWDGNYSSNAQTNPSGPTSGSFRVVRNASWISDARRCRVSARGYNPPHGSNSGLGLRLAL